MRLRFAVILCTSVVSGVFSQGCITITTTGSSGCTIKKALNKSFAFTASDSLYPGGVPDAAQHKATARGVIGDRLSAYTKALRNAHETRHGWVAKTLNRPVEPKLRFKVEFTDTRSPHASVDETGKITVDLQVVEAIFRGSLVEGLREGRFGFGNAFKADVSGDDASLISEFLRLKKSVRDTDCNTMVGEIFGGMEDTSWFELNDYLEVGEKVERKFNGALLFVLAHELGHLAFRHFDHDPEGEVEFQRMELEADGYAALLLADMFRNVIAADAFMNQFGFDNQFGGRDLTGYHDFFSNSFERVGFGRSADGRTFNHPSREAREAVADLAFEIVNQQIESDLAARWEAAFKTPREKP